MKGGIYEQQSDRADNHQQNWLDLGRFEIQNVIYLIENALCLYLELCFLYRRGVHFPKIMETRGRTVNNGTGKP